MVEGAALEMLYRGNSIVGSNPTLSAIFILKFYDFAGRIKKSCHSRLEEKELVITRRDNGADAPIGKA